MDERKERNVLNINHKNNSVLCVVTLRTLRLTHTME